MAIYTGGSAAVTYGYEAAGSYGTTPSAMTNIFGLNQKVTGFSLSNTRLNLNKLGQVEPTKFAYGQQQGSLSVGFVFDDSDSHKIFESLYGADASPSSSPFVYPATLAQGGTAPSVTSLTTQVQLQTGSDKMVRTLNGCVVNSLSISTSIGETVNGSVDMTFGREDTAAVATSSSTITQQDDSSYDQAGTPYTFAHGELKASNGTSLQTVAEIQECDVTFSQNSELLYKVGQNYATEAYRRVFDVTGRFRTAWKNSDLIQYVIDQVRTGQELLDTSGVGVELTFTNGSKSLKIEMDDISIADHNVSGIEPVEPVFEEINWQCKASRVTATT
jgi:hypothetical protein